MKIPGCCCDSRFTRLESLHPGGRCAALTKRQIESAGRIWLYQGLWFIIYSRARSGASPGNGLPRMPTRHGERQRCRIRAGTRAMHT